MGVDWRHEIWYGIKTDYKSLSDANEANDYKDPIVGELSILTDSMNGHYGMVGIPIYISEDGRDEQADIPMMEIKPLTDEIKLKIIKYAKTLNIVGEPKVWAFTQYS